MAKKTNTELKQLYEKCSGDHPRAEDLDALSLALRDDQDTLEELGNLTKSNYLKMINGMADPGSERIIKAYIPKLKRDLQYNGAPRVVQLAIDGVILAWLRWQEHESTYTNKTRGTMNIEEAAFWERRLTASQSRYLRAITTLARVQKLARNDPAFQLNIALDGGQQVNISGDYKAGTITRGKEVFEMAAARGDSETGNTNHEVIEGEITEVTTT